MLPIAASIQSMSALLRQFGFLLALTIAIAVAFVVPELGSKHGLLGTAWLGNLAIGIIFFTLGLQLKTEQLADDLREWKLHLLILAALFVIFPATVMLVLALSGNLVTPRFHPGLIYLAMLPTTISTSTVFTMQARGNVPAAVFNSTLSNALAVLLVPAWMSWQLTALSSTTTADGQLIFKIGALVLAPLVLGQLLRPLARQLVDKNRSNLATWNNGIILFLVFRAFCQSVVEDVWTGILIPELVILIALCGCIHALIALGAWTGATTLSLGRKACITALFSASHKSLATGVAMSSALVAAYSELDQGLLLLPVLIYAGIQLSSGTFIIGNLARTEHLPKH